ncbi:hypothetical protein GQ600_707 [Phytophthora cactorum]|nr:hypothetical protein GQ600_707 [Phytophthora cactorum]
MDSDSDEDVLTHRRVARELLEASGLKQLHGDWEVASKLRRYGLALLYDSYLGIPFPKSSGHSHACCSGLEELCIVLHRLAYPNLMKAHEVTSRGKHGDGMGHWQFFYHSFAFYHGRTRATTRYREGLGHAAAPATFAPPRTRPPKLPQQASGSGPLRTPTSDSAQSPALVTKPRPPRSACCSSSRTPSASRKAAPTLCKMVGFVKKDIATLWNVDYVQDGAQIDEQLCKDALEEVENLDFKPIFRKVYSKTLDTCRQQALALVVQGSVIVALMDNTRLHVYPGCFGEQADREKRKTPVLQRVTVLVFRGDLAHARPKYDELNVRLHCYVQVSGVRQKPNSTEAVMFQTFRCDKCLRTSFTRRKLAEHRRTCSERGGSNAHIHRAMLPTRRGERETEENEEESEEESEESKKKLNVEGIRFISARTSKSSRPPTSKNVATALKLIVELAPADTPLNIDNPPILRHARDMSKPQRPRYDIFVELCCTGTLLTNHKCFSKKEQVIVWLSRFLG